jgi:hypothetical protein
MMPDQNIKPLNPVVPTGNVLKKNKSPDKKAPDSAVKDGKKDKPKKKGIIDTYA